MQSFAISITARFYVRNQQVFSVKQLYIKFFFCHWNIVVLFSFNEILYPITLDNNQLK